MNNSFLTRILDNFDEFPEKHYATFISEGTEKYVTWSEFGGYCRSITSRLSKIEPGIVLIFLRDGMKMHASFFGSMFAGLIPSFMPCKSPRQDPEIYWTSHQKLIDKIKPVAIILTEDVFSEMSIAGLRTNNTKIIFIEKIKKDSECKIKLKSVTSDVALLQHSSGTTGLKKGVMLSYNSIEKHAIAYGNKITLTRKDCVVSWLPLYHDMGLMACMIVPAYWAIPIIQIDPHEWISKPTKLFDQIESHNGTLIWLPNFAFELIGSISDSFKKKWDLSSVRAFISCSEVCKPKAFEKFIEATSNSLVTHSTLQCCYAMAETVFAATQTKIGEQVNSKYINPLTLDFGNNINEIDQSENGIRVLSSGKAISGVEIKIYDENKNQVQSGIIGEIGIKGVYLFEGYFGLDDLTNKRLIEGIYYTRDLGFLKDDELYVLGRIDDVIIIQGRNVYSHQIEEILTSINGLKPGRSCAFGVYDKKMGSEALYLICEKDKKNLSREEIELIKREIRNILFSKLLIIPKVIKIVEQKWLVKTSSGKIDRKENKLKYLRL